MDPKINFLKAVLSSHLHKAASRLVSLVEKSADDTEPEPEPEEDDKNKKKKTLMSKIMPIIESVVDHHTA